MDNWAEYAAQTKVEERLWKGIEKELEGGVGVWSVVGIWLMEFEQRFRETCTQAELSYKFAPQKATTQIPYFAATSPKGDVALWLAKIYTRKVWQGPRFCVNIQKIFI